MPHSAARIAEILRLLGLSVRGVREVTGLGRSTASRYARGEVSKVEDATVAKLVESLGLTETQVRGLAPLPVGWPESDPELAERVDRLRPVRGRPLGSGEAAPSDLVQVPRKELADLREAVADLREAVAEAARQAVREELAELRSMLEVILDGRGS